MVKLSKQISSILKEVVESLDISPTDYQRAVNNYKAVGDWLTEGFHKGYYPQCNKEPEIYPQGSINLGTIVKPIQDGKEPCYDIDLVCELKNSQLMLPADVKNQVGLRIKSNDIYKEKLDDEGKRCWTIKYAKTSGIGFHIDILPCIFDEQTNNIKITHIVDKKKKEYEWKSSNPIGYAEWFKSKNTTYEILEKSQKEFIYGSVFAEDGKTLLFESVQNVPDQLVRTPLQRAIQIMKRHRDVFFKSNPKYKPISMIITTLAAQAYTGETDIYLSLLKIIKSLAKHSLLMQKIYLNEEMIKAASLLDLIRKRINSSGVDEWFIPNPVNNEENFADKWHEDNDARAKAFFEWLDVLHKDIESFNNIDEVNDIHDLIEKSFDLKTSDNFKHSLELGLDNISCPEVKIRNIKPWSLFK